MRSFTLYKLDEELNIIDLDQGDNDTVSRLLEDCLTNDYPPQFNTYNTLIK